LFDREGAGMVFSSNSPFSWACEVSEKTVINRRVVVILIIVFIAHWIKSLTNSNNGYKSTNKIRKGVVRECSDFNPNLSIFNPNLSIFNQKGLKNDQMGSRDVDYGCRDG
jgi:hypothetical protein